MTRIMNPFEIFREDWQKLPQNYRYIFIIGTLFIFLTWLRDHWGNWPYHVNPTKFNLGYITFYFGLGLILIGIVFLLFKQFWAWKSIAFLRIKYPRGKMGKTFLIIESEEKKGKLYLYDLKDKVRYWIASGQTYQDLGYFWGDAKTYSKTEFNSISEGPLILTSGSPGR